MYEILKMILYFFGLTIYFLLKKSNDSENIIKAIYLFRYSTGPADLEFLKMYNLSYLSTYSSVFVSLNKTKNIKQKLYYTFGFLSVLPFFSNLWLQPSSIHLLAASSAFIIFLAFVFSYFLVITILTIRSWYSQKRHSS